MGPQWHRIMRVLLRAREQGGSYTGPLFKLPSYIEKEFMLTRKFQGAWTGNRTRAVELRGKDESTNEGSTRGATNEFRPNNFCSQEYNYVLQRKMCAGFFSTSLVKRGMI